MVVEREYIPVGDGLVGDAEVSQFIGRSEIPHQHCRKKADEREQEHRQERILVQEVIFQFRGHQFCFL